MARDTHRDIMGRRLQAYVPERIQKMVIAYTSIEGGGMSRTVATGLKYFFNSMGEKEKENLLRLYDELPEEKKKRPSSKG
jgi:hypothetical protein